MGEGKIVRSCEEAPRLANDGCVASAGSSVAAVQSANQDSLPPVSSCQSISRVVKAHAINITGLDRLLGLVVGLSRFEARQSHARCYVQLGGLTDY